MGRIVFCLFCLCSPVYATSYYLAPASQGGNDSNSGTSPTAPWLSPNHFLNCGDTIIAAPGTYSEANFGFGKWGIVACPSGNDVAWLKCATFDACKINGSASPYAIFITASYWGVQGWEVTTSAQYQPCFSASPPSSSANIHHIIFANNVANGCVGSGLNSFPNGSAGVDYLAIVGNVAYNAAQGSSFCYSGIGIAAPTQTDSLPGTHIFVAGNFSFANFDPRTCNGTTPTDGEGIILDTWAANNYSAQAVVENNILLANGGRGLQFLKNGKNGSGALLYSSHNTVWGNNGDRNQNTLECAELLLSTVFNVGSSFDLAVTNTANGCGGLPIYAYYVTNGDPTDHIDNDWGYGVAEIQNTQAIGSTGFSFGLNNTLGTDPHFAHPVAPGPPTCSGLANVPACMATVIADFTPTNPAATSFGYQKPLATSVYDPLFPQWLCNVNLPSGLVTIGCLSSSSTTKPAGPRLSRVGVQ